MRDAAISMGLLVAGVILMGSRLATRRTLSWSDPVNVIGLSLALTGALLLAIRVPRPDPEGHRGASRRLVGLALWPRFLVGLWLLFNGLLRPSVNVVSYTYTALPLGAEIGLEFLLPRDKMLFACYAVVGLIACGASMVTAAREGKDWGLMIAVLILAPLVAACLPSLY